MISEVCASWKQLVGPLLYADVRIRHGRLQLKSTLAGSDTQEPCGKFVRRLVLPYSQTATPRAQAETFALDILKECTRLETIVRPRRDQMDSLQWEFPAPDMTLESVTRLEWWHYNDAARTGGINSFQDVLRRTPNLRYLSIGGDLWLTFTGATSPVCLPHLTTLQLHRMNVLFFPLICRWEMPALTNVVVSASSQGIEGFWDTQGVNLQLVEFGDHLRFFVHDEMSLVLEKCPNLKTLQYYVFFMSKCQYLGRHSAITTVGLHAHPCSLFNPDDESTAQHVGAHLTFISASFPHIQQLHLYGDWTPFTNAPQFLDTYALLISRGVSVIFIQVSVPRGIDKDFDK